MGKATESLDVGIDDFNYGQNGPTAYTEMVPDVKVPEAYQGLGGYINTSQYGGDGMYGTFTSNTGDSYNINEGAYNSLLEGGLDGGTLNKGVGGFASDGLGNLGKNAQSGFSIAKGLFDGWNAYENRKLLEKDYEHRVGIDNQKMAMATSEYNRINAQRDKNTAQYGRKTAPTKVG